MNEKCQIFTPIDYVNKLLDSINYTEKIFDKKILENSCGIGNILVVIVERYIVDGRKQGFSDEEISVGLSEHIFGVEIDEERQKQCLQNLKVIADNYGLSNIQWNIINMDYLRWECDVKFDFIVGNPPYITYQELEKEDRVYLKKNFESCKKGKFDYCYAFVEKSLNSLAVNGKMSYLIPSSIFKTVFGENLREIIKPYLTNIQDYTQDKMFVNVLVKSAIIVLHKTSVIANIHYHDTAGNIASLIPRAILSKKWVFKTNEIVGTRRFGDYYKVSHVVATLLNKAFVLKDGSWTERPDCFLSAGIRIEKNVVRETVSPRSKHYKNNEKIIFPYYFEGEKLIRYSEKQFLDNFPGAATYLNIFREELDKRKSDKNSQWFEYGRSQALAEMNKCKLLISTVITEKIIVYPLDKECIPYAGMYIIPKGNNELYNIEFAKKALESQKFLTYVKGIGIPISGSSLRITSKDVEDYKF